MSCTIFYGNPSHSLVAPRLCEKWHLLLASLCSAVIRAKWGIAKPNILPAKLYFIVSILLALECDTKPFHCLCPCRMSLPTEKQHKKKSIFFYCSELVTLTSFQWVHSSQVTNSTKPVQIRFILRSFKCCCTIVVPCSAVCGPEVTVSFRKVACSKAMKLG